VVLGREQCVEVYARVLPAEGEEDAGLFLDCGVDVLQARANFLKGKRFAQSEVQVFREAVIGKLTSLQRCASFETESGSQVRLGERVQEPGETVIPFEDIFADAQPSGSRETIGKREMFLCGINHVLRSGSNSDSVPMPKSSSK
jgi:hypothetical protein